VELGAEIMDCLKKLAPKCRQLYVTVKYRISNALHNLRILVTLFILHIIFEQIVRNAINDRKLYIG